MTSLPGPVTQLVAALGRLPGIGPRSAERLALHLVQGDAEAVRQLAAVLVDARERVASCERCGALTEHQPCPVCADERRDGSQLCVVERALAPVLGKSFIVYARKPEDATVSSTPSREAHRVAVA